MNVRSIALVFILLWGCHRESQSPPAEVRLVGGSELLRALVGTYNREIQDVVFSSIMTHRPGSIGAVDAVERGVGQAALTGSGVAYTAFTTGTHELPHPHRNLRGMAVLSVSAVHLVVRPGLPFLRLTDLSGRKIAIGPEGANTEVTARKLLPQFGISEKHLETPPFPEIPRLLADGLLDAHFFVRTYPDQSIEADLAVPGARLVSISQEEATKLREKYPYLKPIVLPAGTYPKQEHDVHTLGIDLLLVCRADLNDELVYRMLHALFDAIPELTVIEPSLGSVRLDQAPATPVPLHPGAARFYRERGLFR